MKPDRTAAALALIAGDRKSLMPEGQRMRMSRAELEEAYKELFGRVMVVEETAHALRRGRAGPERTARILLAALGALEAEDRAFWKHPERTIDQWTGLFEAMEPPDEMAVLANSSPFDEVS